MEPVTPSTLICLGCFGGPDYRRMTKLCIEIAARAGGSPVTYAVFSDGSYVTARSDVTVWGASHIVDSRVDEIRRVLGETAVSAGAVDKLWRLA